MIISRVELKHPRLFLGQNIHQFRRADGYDIRVDGCTLVVMHKDGAGIVLPVSDMSASYTEPTPGGVAAAISAVQPSLSPTFETKRVDASKDSDITRVTTRPTKDGKK